MNPNRFPLKIKRLTKTARLPIYATPDSAGADLHADTEVSIPLQPGEQRIIPTGIAVALPPHLAILICPRSGLSAKSGITVHNGPGVIDADYRLGLGVILHNTGYQQFVVHPGDRIAQMVIVPVYQTDFEEVADLDVTSRLGGFGSTGVSTQITGSALEVGSIESVIAAMHRPIKLSPLAELCGRGMTQDFAEQMRRSARNDSLPFDGEVLETDYRLVS